MTSALFANMVVQQTNMALMFLGQVPHPQTGEHMHDLDGARLFIDQLEMLAVKTKGNLDKNEERLLQQSLTGLRMAFVEAADKQPAPAEKKEPAGPTASTATGTPQPGIAAEKAGAEGESHKKFTKKY